jgi:hypothetical protein
MSLHLSRLYPYQHPVEKGWPTTTDRRVTYFPRTRLRAPFVYTYIYIYIENGEGSELDWSAVIYKQRYSFLFLDINAKIFS